MAVSGKAGRQNFCRATIRGFKMQPTHYTVNLTVDWGRAVDEATDAFSEAAIAARAPPSLNAATIVRPLV